jgi:hypothetical protein
MVSPGAGGRATPPPSSARDHASACGQGGFHPGRNPKARVLPYHDLYPCPQPGRTGSTEPSRRGTVAFSRSADPLCAPCTCDTLPVIRISATNRAPRYSGGPEWSSTVTVGIHPPQDPCVSIRPNFRAPAAVHPPHPRSLTWHRRPWRRLQDHLRWALRAPLRQGRQGLHRTGMGNR